MELIDLLGLVCFLPLSIGGNMLINRYNKNGFLVWILANLGWILVGLFTQVYSLVLLYTIYTYLAVRGYQKWKKKEVKSSPGSPLA